jgi:hypothetical protein
MGRLIGSRQVMLMFGLADRRPIRGLAGLMLVAVSLAGCSIASAPASGGGEATALASAAASVAASVPASAAASETGGGGGATGAPVAVGGDLCKLLGPGDFTAVGVTDATGPTENPTDPLNNYCVYRGKSSATGGIEFDISISDTAADAAGVFDGYFAEVQTSSDFTNINLTGADQGLMSLPNAATSTDPALIAIQAGKLTYAIGMGIPFADAQNQKAADKLMRLAALVLQRGAALGH